MGSKSRIAKDIVPIIQGLIDKYEIKTYIEPLCGGCNVIDKIVCDTKIASDNNRYLIAILQNLDKIAGIPDFVTKEHYSDVRSCFNADDGRYPDWYIGAVGILASYNGRFFDGGYAGLVRTGATKNIIRNYYDEGVRNLKEQIPHLTGIDFRCCDYADYNPMDWGSCLFYLDPPYDGAKQYGPRKFNHPKFWAWAREMAVHNIVLVSEHTAPEDIKCIWEQPIKRTIDNTKRVDTVERLFLVGDRYGT